jgi:hypothetical protein
LSTAFSPTSIPRQSTAPPSLPETPDSSSLEPPISSQSDTAESLSSNDDWKTEYESQVRTWRTQSAEARQKAEKERDRWEAIREAEKKDAERRKAEGKNVHLEGHESGWETVGPGQTSRVASSGQILSPSPVDARDLVTGEPPSASKVRYVCNSFLVQTPYLGVEWSSNRAKVHRKTN